MAVVNLFSLPENWKDDPSYVYIGRTGHGLDGKWGNPFRLHREEERAEILKKYMYFLLDKLGDPQFASEVTKLSNKTLVCFCAPKPCHGDILQAFAKILTDFWM